MGSAAGRAVGPYQLRERIGAGGMGEVFRAFDPRLGRTVAIKKLPPGVDDSSTARERFVREAHAIAALSHPNICTIYDVGLDGDQCYLVLEHLQGRTLEALVKGARTPAEAGSAGAHGIPLRTGLRYAVQIASALEAAHEKGSSTAI